MLTTGTTNWSIGFRFHAFGLLGELDAPGLIAAGSHIADPWNSYGAAATVTVRASGRASSVSTLYLHSS